MTSILIIVAPVFIILSIIIQLKLSERSSYLLIVLMGALTPILVDFYYCSMAGEQCKTDAFLTIGFIFLASYIITLCSVIYAVMPDRFKRLDSLSCSQETKLNV